MNAINNRLKKMLMTLLSLTLILTLAPAVTFAADGQKNWVADSFKGTNLNSHSYTQSASPVGSYLLKVPQGYMRVQSSGQSYGGFSGYLIEYFDSNFDKLSERIIDSELPRCGGFFESNGYYYLVTGQNNPTEDNSQEVFRITKFDNDWNRIGSDSLRGANTTYPFSAGSCRMAASGKYLVVHTCHKMYKANDGFNHQANVTFIVDTDQMKILDSRTIVGGGGYCSHSFNQFVIIDNEVIYTVDHGDAYPRSVVLTRYPDAIETGNVSKYGVQINHILKIRGATGDNTTGVSIGAFENLADNLLIAGNSIDQNDENSIHTRNIFIASVDKESGATTFNWLTHYPEQSSFAGARTPILVRVNDDKYAVLWKVAAVKGDPDSTLTRCMFVNGKGEAISDLYKFNAQLSDCQPVLSDGNLVWYVWDQNTVTFYSMPISDPEGIKAFVPGDSSQSDQNEQPQPEEQNQSPEDPTDSENTEELNPDDYDETNEADNVDNSNLGEPDKLVNAFSRMQQTISYKKNVTIYRATTEEEFITVKMGKRFSGKCKIKLSSSKKSVAYCYKRIGKNVLIKINKSGTAVLKMKVTKNGKSKTYKMKVKVKKYACPVKSLKIGNIETEREFRKDSYAAVDNSAKNFKVNIKAANGWEIKDIWFQSIAMDNNNDDECYRITNGTLVRPHLKNDFDDFLIVKCYNKAAKRTQYLELCIF